MSDWDEFRKDSIQVESQPVLYDAHGRPVYRQIGFHVGYQQGGGDMGCGCGGKKQQGGKRINGGTKKR